MTDLLSPTDDFLEYLLEEIEDVPLPEVQEVLATWPRHGLSGLSCEVSAAPRVSYSPAS